LEKYWKNSDLKASFEYSRAIIKHYAKSFSFAAKFLPKEKRWATYSVYAFCRYVDNIIDLPRNRTNEELVAELNNLRHEIELAYKYGESEHPALSAFIFSAKKFNIPKEYPLDLINGVEMDLTCKSYDNFADLYLFCYRVAGVVGLMMTYILGFKNEETLYYAEKLGVAMQLTNILRDIETDYEMGRVYLPQDELLEFNLTNLSIADKQFNDSFKNMMKFQVSRAENYYDTANVGISQLDKDSQFAIYTASRIYGRILNKIIENNYNPFSGRVFVPKFTKFAILGSEIVKRKFNFGIYKFKPAR